MNQSGILAALEQLLDEFFSAGASNARKHEIETQLGQVKHLPDFGKLCLFIVTNSSSQLATMFALSSLETVINQQWIMTDWTYKEELKNVLYGYLLEKGGTAPHYLRNKHAKLLVDIAKQDWPTRYPHFFTNILELLKNDQSRLIGLILLRTTSEEFMGPNSNFNSERKEEITRLMQHYIPQAFEVLTGILQTLDIKPKLSGTATPPPSPTHPTSPHNFPHQLSAASFKTDVKSLKKELLLTIQHLFTWAPIGQIPADLIPCVLRFTNVYSYAQEDDDMCILAMCTLNEILYRRCTPPGTEDFFVRLYQHTVQLLRDIVCPTAGRIETLSPDLVEKLTELTTLLIEQHLWRLEMEPRFSAMEFLSLLYQFTMQLSAPQCYLHCLSVWNAFLKQIKPQNAHKYSEVFHGLVAAILKKIQFTYNSKQLESAEDETFDESDSERQIFIKTSIEIIAMIAEYSPIEIFNQILSPWKMCGEIYFSFLNRTEPTLFLSPDEEVQKLHYFIKDFSVLTQLSARLSSLFVDQDNDEVNKIALPMLDGLTCKLLECATLAMNNRLFEKSQVPTVIQDALIEVYSELLAALKTWLVWLNQNAATSSVQMKQLVDVALKTLHLSVDTYIPEKVSHAAAHLFLGITDVVFPPHLITLPPILQLIHRAPLMVFKKPETKLIMSGAMCNLLLRSWGELSQDDAAQRNYLIGLYFDTLTREFRELNGMSEEAKIKRVVENTLSVLAHCVDCCKKLANASKKLLCHAIKSSIEHALFLFPHYVKYPEVSNHILILFLNVLSVLQQQIGVEGTKNAVQVFLQVAVSEQQANNLTGLDKLLQILQFVVDAPGTSYKNFLPGILELCLKNVYPVIVNQASEYPDVYIALLTLLHSVLLHRWQYFYISQVRLGYSPGCSESEVGPDIPQHSDQFLCILEVFGQALLQQDLNIFRIGLAAIEDLNTKWKLYHKVLFKDRLLVHFTTILLQTLMHKTHALLNDEVQLAVFNMASVNFDFFFNSLLRQFVSTVDGVAAEQWDVLVRNFVHYHDKDMPTFVQHLQRFIDDTRHYRMCNMSAVPQNVLTS